MPSTVVLVLSIEYIFLYIYRPGSSYSRGTVKARFPRIYLPPLEPTIPSHTFLQAQRVLFIIRPSITIPLRAVSLSCRTDIISPMRVSIYNVVSLFHFQILDTISKTRGMLQTYQRQRKSYITYSTRVSKLSSSKLLGF